MRINAATTKKWADTESKIQSANASYLISKAAGNGLAHVVQNKAITYNTNNPNIKRWQETFGIDFTNHEKAQLPE